MEQLNTIQKNTSNQHEFLLAMEKAGIQTYSRNNGEVTGVYAPNSKRKFRFRTLGIDIQQEKKEEKNKLLKEEQDIEVVVKSKYQERLKRLKTIRESQEQENEQDNELER